MNRYVLGMDGGGTKTAALAMDLSGKELLRLQGGPMNLNGETPDVIRDVIHQLLQETKAKLGPEYELVGLCIGAAGISNAAAEQVIRSTVERSHYSGALLLTGDHATALAGALGRAEGIILISGTGSICAGRTADGREARAGGRGHIIDDEGSGYAMGRDVLRAVIEAQDGRGPETCLTEAVYHQLGIRDANDIVAFVHTPSRPKRDIAALAQLLSDSLAQQDAVAMGIYQKAAFHLSRLIFAVADRLDYHTGEVALAGSALKNSDYLRSCLEVLAKEREPGLKLVLPHNDAAWGAAYLARTLVKDQNHL